MDEWVVEGGVWWLVGWVIETKGDVERGIDGDRVTVGGVCTVYYWTLHPAKCTIVLYSMACMGARGLKMNSPHKPVACLPRLKRVPARPERQSQGKAKGTRAATLY